ncbi:MAG: hypothetical protein HY648_10930 [Acidobacteria bacterium]|nr:hypothetical protein [Acidobacteriota bacterium]
MLDAFLVPEITVEANGESQPVLLGDGAAKTHLLTLAITDIVEQESLDVNIWGSPDGNDWGTAPLVSFPQKFYQGIYQLVLDLQKKPELKFLKVKWGVNRWGVGSQKPKFSFLLKIQEKALVGMAS